MADEDGAQWVLVEKMASTMQAIKEQVDLIPEMRTDVAAVKSDVADLKGKMISVEVILAEHSKALKQVTTDIRRLDIRVQEIGSDVRTVKTRLTLIEGDLKEVKGYVGTHHEAIVELKTASHSH
jgi:peptidoglycan hydrolase CwlO-like protein